MLKESNTDLESRIIRSLRARYKKYVDNNADDFKSTDLVNIQAQNVSDLIVSKINDSQPFLLSRFGSEEIKWYTRYKLLSRSYPSRVWSYITYKTETWKTEGKIIDNITLQPKSLLMTEVFIQATENAITEIDLLGSWLKLEQSPVVQSKLNCKSYAFLLDIEPYYHPYPWSAALANKRVLVIHPMTKSIIDQYKKRKVLFNNPEVLPNFELLTLQAKYFDDPVFNTWEKIYNYYLDELTAIDFDIAIVGCGSWGMPVAAEIKKRGKIALHLGGATQLLFGITGNRWETIYPEFTRKFVNRHWIRPSSDETPQWAKTYDNKSYW